MSEAGSVLTILIVLLFALVALVDITRSSGAGIVGAVILVSVVPILMGTVLLTQAVAGVGVIAVGCWLAIVARIMQAERHNKQKEPVPDPEEPKARLRREAKDQT